MGVASSRRPPAPDRAAPRSTHRPNRPDATVAALRAEADQAAQAYFDALARAEALEAQVAAIEEQLPALQARRRDLRADARRRAALAYVRAGQTGGLFDASTAADATRRSQWLEQLNARDAAAFDELETASDRTRHPATRPRSRRATHNRSPSTNSKRRTATSTRSCRPPRISSGGWRPRPRRRGPSSRRPTTARHRSAPPDYTGTPGTHSQHDHPFLVCTRARESGGNYAAYNPAGPYMGAYQFHQSTWNSAANHAGRPELIGVPPHTASQYDQDDMGWALYQWQGTRPWGGHCG